MIERLCFEERQEIERMINEGHSGISIAQYMHRSKNCINTEIRNNGGREAYTAYEAQAKSDTVRRLQNEAVSEKLKGHKDSFGWKERVEALENGLIALSLEVEKLKKNRVAVKK